MVQTEVCRTCGTQRPAVSPGAQHPGVAPAHELGTLPDLRPYFTMKLVKGRTLAELLSESSKSPADRRNLLAVFLQVVHTIAYAHNYGVLHLDSKPANNMVDNTARFGRWTGDSPEHLCAEARPPEASLRAGDVFRFWLQDAEFARVRSREALAKLPAQERDAWQAFWREVDTCIAGES
jgi:serine/threonine protein kinase